MAIASASGYDANGNLISDGTRTFTYDADNRLRSVTGGRTSVTLNYDPFGRLSSSTAGSATTTFSYFGAWTMAENTGGAGIGYTHDAGGNLVALNDGRGYSYFHTDRLGSVIVTSNPLGHITPYTYGPYGEPQSWAGSRIRYTGHMAIPEAQLYHYRARAYDPMMGRFLQTDPIGYGDGPNIYAYVHGDPVNGTDPSGTMGPDDSFLTFGGLFTNLSGVDITGLGGKFITLQFAPSVQLSLSLSGLSGIGNLNINIGQLGGIVKAGISKAIKKLAKDIEPGPHQYSIKTAVCSESARCTVDNVYTALKLAPAPGVSLDKPVTDGQVSDVFPFGPIGTAVHDDEHSITNVTLNGHWLEPGVVTRTVVDEGGIVSILSEGSGNGWFPAANQAFAPDVWGNVTPIQLIVSSMGK